MRVLMSKRTDQVCSASFSCVIGAALLLAACGKSSDPTGFKPGTTIDDLKAQSAAIARQQDEAAAAAKDTRTALSRKATEVNMGMPRAKVIALLGPPSNVIAPQNLAKQNYERSREIDHVLTWDNPGCYRVEVVFGTDDRATGIDRGELCTIERPMSPGYSCAKAANARYCRTNETATPST
jgi:hypothetical protein